MSEIVEPLIADLLLWLEPKGRRYEEVMEIWRTSCPRLPVWEEANERGLLIQEEAEGRAIVKITPAGEKFLAIHRKFIPPR